MDTPEGTVDALVETPQGSRKKYELDHDRRAMRLDRRIFSATVYPVDYGLIPGTEGADGEELDILIVTEEPTFPGCWVTARPIGVCWIAYDDQREAKIIAVPHGDPTWDDVTDLDDLPDHIRDEIGHFFEVYKTLEPGRTPTTDGWEGRDAAMSVIADATTGRDAEA
ncbi:MAG: inorganic diphosphatase [Acidimicrobiales bacterium]